MELLAMIAVLITFFFIAKRVHRKRPGESDGRRWHKG